MSINVEGNKKTLPVFTVRFCAQLLIVVVTLAFGGFGLWIGGESLVEVEYLTKQDRVLMISRAKHPVPCWLWTGGIIGGAGLTIWFSLWVFRASLNESRRLRRGGQDYSSCFTR